MQVVESPPLATRGGATIEGTPLRRSGRQSPSSIAEAETPALVVVAPAGDAHGSSRCAAFGQRLQAARERRGVSIEEIAQATKMSATLLAALERGDASRWPKGLFRRAFFRDYAAAIGLAVEPNVSEFLHLFPDGEDHSMAAAAFDSAAAPALRLALAPRATWRVSPADIRQEVFTAGAVLLLALVVTMWIDGTPATFLGVSGLCYSSRLAMLAIRWIASMARRRRSGALPPPHDHQSVGL